MKDALPPLAVVWEQPPDSVAEEFQLQELLLESKQTTGRILRMYQRASVGMVMPYIVAPKSPDEVISLVSTVSA